MCERHKKRYHFEMHFLTLIVPAPLEARTGGYEYDRRMVAGLGRRGWSVEVRELDETFPHPTRTALADAARVLSNIPNDATVLVDGLALGAMPAEAEREAMRLRIVALVHLPLAAEIGIDRETAIQLEASERRALAAAALVIVTGRSTVAALANYGVGHDRVAVVEPGTDRAPLARGSREGPLHLLSVATLSAGKGHDILFRALEAAPHRNWRLTCAGSPNRDPTTVARLRGQLRASGLEDRVSLVGELDGAALAACYESADLFVLATLRETYGMAVAEAVARGLPVVGTRTGAIPELLGERPHGPANRLRQGYGESAEALAEAEAGHSVHYGPAKAGHYVHDAGLLVPPGDVDAMTDALSQVLGDARLRAQLAEGARRMRDRLPTWDEAVSKMVVALERLRW